MGLCACQQGKPTPDDTAFIASINCLVDLYYSIEDDIKEGVTSSVVSATSKEVEGRMVAIKRVNEDLWEQTFRRFGHHPSQDKFGSRSSDYKDGMLRVDFEIDVLRKLRHPNIIRLYEAFESSRGVDLIMEYCLGGDLVELINRCYSGKFPNLKASQIPVNACRFLFRQMVDAVAYLHAIPLGHRDIKPENILFLRPVTSLLDADLHSPHTTPRLLLCDFGSSVIAHTGVESKGDITFTRTSSLGYSAPELLHTTRVLPTELKADIWALGCVLYTMLVGQSPFRPYTSMPARDVKASILAARVFAHFDTAPDEIRVAWQALDKSPARQLCERLLEKDTSARPSAHAILEQPWMCTEKKNVDVMSEHIVGGMACWSRTDLVQRLVVQIWTSLMPESSIPHIGEWVTGFLHLANATGKIPVKEGCREFVTLFQGTKAGGAKVPKRTLAKYFRLLDSNRSGTIDWLEWLAPAFCGDVLSDVSRARAGCSIVYRRLLGDAAFVDQNRIKQWCSMRGLRFEAAKFQKWANGDGIIDTAVCLQVLESFAAPDTAPNGVYSATTE